MNDDETQTIVVKQGPSIDGKTLIIGGGVVGLLLWFFFFRGGGGGGKPRVLEFRLRRDGLWLGHYLKIQTYSEAIAKVRESGTTSAVLIVAGDVPQGEVDRALAAFAAADITLSLKQPQSISSLYARGSGQYS